jgi:hypothetical protein
MDINEKLMKKLIKHLQYMTPYINRMRLENIKLKKKQLERQKTLKTQKEYKYHSRSPKRKSPKHVRSK